MLIYTCSNCGENMQGILVGNTWGPAKHKCKNNIAERDSVDEFGIITTATK